MPAATLVSARARRVFRAPAAPMQGPRVLACASQGTGGDDEDRLRALLSCCSAHYVPFDRAHKAEGFRACMAALRAGGFDLFVLEGTGFAAGLAALLGRLLYRRRYVLGSGDAVGPFLSARMPLAAPVFHLYERLLCRAASGFIGWTPYLAGRALTLGAPAAITCPGWAPSMRSAASLQQARTQIRERLGIPEDALVFGIAGSLVWSPRYRYCYGMELVRALAQTAEPSVYVLIVGDGSGLKHLRHAAGTLARTRIVFTGRVPRAEIPGYLAAMDIASLPQSLDGVGSFRYTTKLAEYRAAGLPFVANRTPMSYDLDDGDIHRLPGSTPWSAEFVTALAGLMQSLSPHATHARRTFAPAPDPLFCRESQVARTTAFLSDLAAIEEQA